MSFQPIHFQNMPERDTAAQVIQLLAYIYVKHMGQNEHFYRFNDTIM